MSIETSYVRDLVESIVKDLPAVFKHTSILSVCIDEQDHLEDFMFKMVSEKIKDEKVHVRMVSMKGGEPIPSHKMDPDLKTVGNRAFNDGDIIINLSIWAAYSEYVDYGVVEIKGGDYNYLSRDKVKARNPIHICEFPCY